MKYFFRLLILGIVFGLTYMGIEILWRGYTFLSMGLISGIVGVMVGYINEYFTWEIPLWKQGLIGALIGTTGEFFAGCIINLWLGLNQWDYSNMWGNILGQVCVPYMILWFGLSIVCILMDDYMRWKFFGEEKPRYKIIK